MGSTDHRNTLCELLRWRLILQGLARPLTELHARKFYFDARPGVAGFPVGRATRASRRLTDHVVHERKRICERKPTHHAHPVNDYNGRIQHINVDALVRAHKTVFKIPRLREYAISTLWLYMICITGAKCEKLWYIFLRLTRFRGVFFGVFFVVI